MNLFKKEPHYWRATIMFQTKDGQRYARWFKKSRGKYFPVLDMESEYFSKYGFRPTLLFWGEISKEDYMKLTSDLKPNV